MHSRLFICGATSLLCLLASTALCGPVPAAAVEKPAASMAVVHKLAVDGTITYRERIALPPGYTVVVRLLDVSRQDAPATEVARVEMTPERQVPVPFRLEVEEARIDQRMTYAVEATIFVDGQRRFITDTLYTVLTRGQGHRVHLVLVGTGGRSDKDGARQGPKPFVLPVDGLGAPSPVTPLPDAAPVEATPADASPADASPADVGQGASDAPTGGHGEGTARDEPPAPAPANAPGKVPGSAPANAPASPAADMPQGAPSTVSPAPPASAPAGAPAVVSPVSPSSPPAAGPAGVPSGKLPAAGQPQ